MPNLPLGGIVRTRIVWFGESQIGEITQYWSVISIGGIPATDTDVAITLLSNCAATAVALCPREITFRGVGAQIIDPLPVYQEQIAPTGGTVCTASGDLLPTQTTGLIRFKTPQAGRAYRGRNYIPFPATSFVDTDGNPTSGYHAALVAFIDATYGVMGMTISGRTAVLNQVIWHRKTRTSDRTNFVEASPRWATQRRRGNFGRVNTVPF